MSEPLSLVGGILAGCMTLPMDVHETAVSPESDIIRSVEQTQISSAERSIALFGPRSKTIGEIYNTTLACSESGWDGEDAAAISVHAAEIAVRFIRSLPIGYPMPEIAPLPDGTFSLDWITSRARVLTLSVGPSAAVSFAWTDGASRGYGVSQFDGKIAGNLLRLVADIVGLDADAIRAA